MISNIRTRVDKLPRWLAYIIHEGWPIIVLLFALIIEFRHIANSGWLQVFLYNGDSITLPVIGQALAHKDPFLWVSSSQFLLFPEGIFYAISSLLTKSVRAALVFNGSLNIIVLYVLFRWISGLFIKTARYVKQLFALGCCLLLIFYMLLERQPLVNSSSVATLFIFTAYYYGIIISGVSLVGISLQQAKPIKRLSALSASQLLLASIAFLVAGLTTFSDPIFIIQFTFPLLIALGVVFLCNGLRFKNILLICLPVLGGSVIGYLARAPFKAFVGVSLGSHIVTQQIPGTLTTFHQSISYDLHNKPSLVELILVFGVIAYSAIYIAWWMYQKTRYKDRLLDGRLFLLALFAVIEPPVIILFSIFSGSMVTRYLLPMFVFPMLGLLSILAIKPRGVFLKVMFVISTVIILVTVLLGAVSVGKAKYVLSSSSYTDPKCLAAALHNRPAYGVGSYWTVRALDVYGQADEQAVQINYDFSPFIWQSNLGAYKNKQFSFIVVDKQASTYERAVPYNDPSIPSHPSKIYTCSNIYIYVYSPGTSGYNQLNDGIHKAYGNLLRARSAGNILLQPY